MVNLAIYGPGEALENVRTPLASSDDLRALEEEQRAEVTRKAKEAAAWTVFDTLEVGLTCLQAVADSRLLSAAIQLQYDELVLDQVIKRLTGEITTEVVAEQTDLYFTTRDHHRSLLNIARLWIYTSVALDGLHLAGNLANIVTTVIKQVKEDPDTPTDNIQTKIVKFAQNHWRLFLRSAMIYNAISIASNSLWYGIFVTTPTFQPKGVTNFAIKMLNKI